MGLFDIVKKVKCLKTKHLIFSKLKSRLREREKRARPAKIYD